MPNIPLRMNPDRLWVDMECIRHNRENMDHIYTCSRSFHHYPSLDLHKPFNPEQITFHPMSQTFPNCITIPTNLWHPRYGCPSYVKLDERHTTADENNHNNESEETTFLCYLYTLAFWRPSTLPWCNTIMDGCGFVLSCEKKKKKSFHQPFLLFRWPFWPNWPLLW